METPNKFIVSLSLPKGIVSLSPSQGILIGRPPWGAISEEEAILLAAWLVAIADPGRERFEEVFKSVTET